MNFDSKISTPIICYGEILYDIFPNKRLIGGAPFNVVQKIHSLNHPCILVSRVGNDSDGKKAISFLQDQNIPTDFIQMDKKFATRRVKVELNNGHPRYHILPNVAWDYIEYSNNLKHLVSKSKAFIFGSLSSRNIQSRQTLTKLLSLAKNNIFDINLRAPYYNQCLIKALIEKTNFLKCNDQELKILGRYYRLTTRNLNSQIKELIHKTSLRHICVTLGSAGAILYFNQRFYSDNGFQINPLDTVGAGDSFLGTLIHGLYANSDMPPQKVLERANAMGALVASKSGANPIINQNEIHQLIDSRYLL